MKSMGPKHKLQFPTKQDGDQETYGLPNSKRPLMDNNGDETGMFYALVDRATNKMMKDKRETFSAAEATSTAAEHREAKILTGKSTWKPSFEWEDFSYGDMLFGGNWGFSNLSGFAKNSASTLEEIQKQDIGSGEGRLVCSSDKHRPVGSFDLN